ncbi:MAG: type I 3-dehydroquinate dehydratase [Candidatus Kapabacteria bacterium]|nr:type I 3-dehydroquinate dehydratase [Candidatus Kapabacteria bacterium]
MKCLSYGKNDLDLFLKLFERFPLVELRQDLAQFNYEQLNSLPIEYRRKLILTDKSVDETNLKNFVNNAIALKVMAVDLDLELINPKTIESVSKLRSNEVQLILSKHDVDLSQKAELENVFGMFQQVDCDFIKIVYSESERRYIVDYISTFKLFHRKLISFIAGDSMKFTRMLCLVLGSPFTYVALDETVKTGAGQLTIDEYDTLSKVMGL